MEKGNYIVIHNRWLDNNKQKAYTFRVIGGQVVARSTDEATIINALINQADYPGMADNSERRTLVMNRDTRVAVFTPPPAQKPVFPKLLNVRFINVTLTSVTMTWTGVNIQSVDIQWSGPGVVPNPITATSYTFTGLTLFSEYTMTITPRSQTGTLGKSIKRAFRTADNTASLASSALSDVSTTSVTLTWAPGAGYAYSLIRWNGGVSSKVIAAPYTVTGLTQNTTYTFTITPYNRANVAGTSLTHTTTTIASAGPPTITAASTSAVTTTSVTVNWSGSYSYVIVTWPGGGSSGQQTVNSYVVTGLTQSTNYTFTVTPYNSQNVVGTSTTTNVTTSSPSARQAILAFSADTLSAVGVGNQITSWTNSGSGNTYSASALSGSGSTRPTVGTENNKLHVVFNRTASNYFNITPSFQSTWFNVDGVYNGMTIAVVGRYQGGPLGWERWIDFANGPAIDGYWFGRFGNNPTSLAFESYNQGSGHMTSENMTSDTNWHIWIVRITNTATSIVTDFYMDSTTIGKTVTKTSVTINNRTTTNSYIGRSNFNDPYLNAHLRELRIYDKTLTNNEVTSLYTELSGKWGVFKSITIMNSSGTALKWDSATNSIRLNTGTPLQFVLDTSGNVFNKTENVTRPRFSLASVTTGEYLRNESTKFDLAPFVENDGKFAFRFITFDGGATYRIFNDVETAFPNDPIDGYYPAVGTKTTSYVNYPYCMTWLGYDSTTDTIIPVNWRDSRGLSITFDTVPPSETINIVNPVTHYPVAYPSRPMTSVNTDVTGVIYGTGAHIVTGVTGGTTGREVYRAFDYSNATQYQPYGSTTYPSWVQIKLPMSIKLRSYSLDASMYTANTRTPLQWEIYGIQPGSSTLELLHTASRPGNAYNLNAFNVTTNPDVLYDTFRMNVTQANGSPMHILELRFFGVQV